MTISEQKLQDIILSTVLGPILPLYGVVEEPQGQLRCECRGWKECATPGKHPRWFGWREMATTHIGEIELWHRMYPHANWGIMMGKRAIALDCDNRPQAVPPKDGIAELRALEHEIADTITVHSGGGGWHLYFLAPQDAAQLSGAYFYGVDPKNNGVCVAPGSRHISGSYYRFERSPANQEFAKLSQFLVDALAPAEGDDNDVPVETRRELAEGTTSPDRKVRDWRLDRPPDGARPPGRLMPDWVVLKKIKADPQAGPRYFQGVRKFYTKEGKFDRNKDDFALACKLALYTNHNWDQHVKLFERSAVYGAKSGAS